jgi:two-component system nitrate/nitrite response regulator NarL
MRILVADDHTLFRDGLTSLLTAAGHEVIAQVNNGQAAVLESMQLQPDLVLLDISMPLMSGLEALSLIKAQQPEMRVVMLTISEDDAYLLQALQSGANGYLLKSLDSKMFIDSLDAIPAGELAITRDVASRLIRGMVAPEKPAQSLESLTDREVELVGFLVQGMGNRAIAQHMDITENTVKYHLKNISCKLNVKSRTEIIAYAIKNNLI